MRLRNKKGRHMITRIDSRSTHCWFVRVEHCGEILLRKSFSDGVWGGKMKALKAAKEARDEVMKLFKGEKTRYIHKDPSVRNKSGHVGVHIAKKIFGRNTRLYYVGTYRDDVKAPRGNAKSFAALKHGEEEALRLALEFRDTGISHIEKQYQSALEKVAKFKQ